MGNHSGPTNTGHHTPKQTQPTQPGQQKQPGQQGGQGHQTQPNNPWPQKQTHGNPKQNPHKTDK